VTATTSGDSTGAARIHGDAASLTDGATVVPAEPTPLWTVAARDFAAWREGDPQALERLVRRMTPVLWQIARAYGHDRETAEDVVQTTWAALVRGADAVRDPQAVLRWMTITARREAWRAGRVGRREDAVEPEVLEAAAPPEAGPEGTVLGMGRARNLWRHVAELPERCQRLLRVIAFDDRPDYASLSSELAMPVGSIGPTRKRCLNKLRELLAADPEWKAS
jgi:RNA polymerase sigma factor (sigma-70 family)